MGLWKNIKKFFTSRRSIGSRAERAAACYLKKSKHLKVLALNYRHSHYETDIVCYDKASDCIVFVEVKCRPLGAKVAGYYAATSKRKKSNLKKSAIAFLRENFAYGKNYRFDVVEVEHDERGNFVNINHFEGF